jgi:MFS superfamily sulfate permease-like transporter
MDDTRITRWRLLPIAGWLPNYEPAWLRFDLVAGVFALAWLLRLSVLVSFISESILTGFKAGSVLVIASTQLPKLFGVQGGGDDFFERIWQLLPQLPETNLLTLLIGVGATCSVRVRTRYSLPAFSPKERGR